MTPYVAGALTAAMLAVWPGDPGRGGGEGTDAGGSGSQATMVGEPRPVICLHGFNGDASTFVAALEPLRAAGLDPIPLTWSPPDGRTGIAGTAVQVVGPLIDAELSRRGYPRGQRFSVLAHSMGGLVARQLVELEGWDARLDRMVMVSVPNRGARTGLGGGACTLPPTHPWRCAGCDTRRGSPFLDELGTVPTPDLAERYLTIGASWRATPMPGGGDLDGSGRGHANDGVVATESPYLDGVPLRIWKGRGPSQHTRLLCNSVVMGWMVGFLVDGTVPEEEEDGRTQIAQDLCRVGDGAGRDGATAEGAVPLDVERSAASANTVSCGGEEPGSGWNGSAEGDLESELATFRIRVDASQAVDPLVQFKIRRAHLVVRLDGEVVVERTERKVPRGEPLPAGQLLPGEHTLEVRWEVAFRSATDRHHPLGMAPDDLGFAIPDDGFAVHAFSVGADETTEVLIRLYRKAAVGVQGRTWVEFLDGAR